MNLWCVSWQLLMVSNVLYVTHSCVFYNRCSSCKKSGKEVMFCTQVIHLLLWGKPVSDSFVRRKRVRRWTLFSSILESHLYVFLHKCISCTDWEQWNLSWWTLPVCSYHKNKTKDMELCCNLDVKTEESAGVCDLKLLTKDNGKCRHIDLQLMTMNSVVNLIYQLKNRTECGHDLQT